MGRCVLGVPQACWMFISMEHVCFRGILVSGNPIYIYTCDTIEDTIYYNTETDRIEYIVCNIVSAALHITLYIVELI